MNFAKLIGFKVETTSITKVIKREVEAKVLLQNSMTPNEVSQLKKVRGADVLTTKPLASSNVEPGFDLEKYLQDNY